MFDLKRFTEPDPIAGSCEAVAQFNIFDGGLEIRFIESAHREKNLPPDRATGAPKRRSLLPTMLMDIVMEQIAVLRQKVRFTRLIVI